MKLSGLNLLLTLTATALGVSAADASNVFDLDASTFGDHISKHSLVLAEFFAPWCGHCKNLAPEYEEAATALHARDEDITLAKIDCTENQDLCSQYDVKGFPTLHVFENGEKTGSYEGARKADDIASFLVKRAQPAVVDLDSTTTLDAWLAQSKENGVAVSFAYFGSAKDLPIFSQVALKNRERLGFAAQPDNKELAKKYGGQVVAFVDGADEPRVFPKADKLDDETLGEFVKANSFASFGELGPDTYRAYISSGVPMLYAFVEDDAQRELVKKALTPRLAELHGKAHVVFLDAVAYPQHAENVNLRQEFPAMVVHDTTSNKKYTHSQDIDFNVKSINEFVSKYLKGHLKPQIKSEPVPEKQDEPVWVLVGSEYDSVVLDNDKDVLVEFYAPWCGHCKTLKPKYDELAELYANNDDVVIAKVDHTVNDVPDEIQGYPTIKLFPAGKKDQPIEFQGSRDVESLAKFIKENGSKKAAPKAKVVIDEDIDAKMEL